MEHICMFYHHFIVHLSSFDGEEHRPSSCYNYDPARWVAFFRQVDPPEDDQQGHSNHIKS
jgi:hypothetical protein